MIKDYTDSLISTVLAEDYTSPYLGKCNPDLAIKFYSQLKRRILDLDLFHQAFDDEIQRIGLMHIFNDAGKLAHRGTYGPIKTYADQKLPVIIALKKLWAAQYVDNLKSEAEKKAAEEERKELEKRKEEERLRAERERLEKEAKEKAIQEMLDAKAEEIIPLLNQSLYEDLLDTVPDEIMAKPRLVIQHSKLFVTLTQSKTAKNPQSYSYLYEGRPFTGEVTDKDLKDFATKLKTLLPGIIAELDNLQIADNISKLDFLKLKAVSYIIKDGKDYLHLSFPTWPDHTRITSYDNLTTGKSDLEPISEDAVLLGVVYPGPHSKGRCWYDNTDYISFSDKLPPAIIEKLKWYDYEKGTFTCGSKFKLVTDLDEGKFTTEYGLNKHGISRDWCDSSD